MALIKVIALVLGSVWFFPVSCTTGLVAGVRIAGILDARDVARGDQVHSISAIVAEPGSEGRPFRVLKLREVQQGQVAGEARYLMSRSSGRIDVNQYTYVAYSLIEDRGSEQVIEVRDNNDDRTVWLVYRATQAGVTPLSSRMNYFGYMFTAFPFAFGAALALYWTGRYLRRRIRSKNEAATPA